MRTSPRRSLVLLAAVAALAAACGQSRELAEPATTTAAGAESTQATLAPTPTTEPIVLSDAAAADEVAIRITYADGEVAEILTGEIETVYEANINSQALIDLNQGAPFPATYATDMANQLMLIEVLRHEIESRGETITDDEMNTSRDELLGQLAGFYDTPDEADAAAEDLSVFLDVLTDTRAHQLAFERVLATDLDPATDGVPCVRHILVETEAEADAILTRLGDGEDFAALAIELSTGPSGPAGGELGCTASSSYVPEFAAAVDGADLNTPVGPVETQFGFHVLEVTDREVQAGTLAQDTYFATVATLDVEVTNPGRYGTWDGAVGEIVAPS